ncbi:hypothetical protein [Oribacterium sp. WCC10]|uniref:hypothetical protein n=1 Tax=Oribacterium sp. WCC10 TaxID=1855343 RepID=UPI0008EC6A55|nr:hypothetical protein [Oribacterium sp. WCC10]SFG10187.1 hypothetical protein SAMN05216356_101259 [Oribacterium sp. WCC10]
MGNKLIGLVLLYLVSSFLATSAITIGFSEYENNKGFDNMCEFFDRAKPYCVFMFITVILTGILLFLKQSHHITSDFTFAMFSLASGCIIKFIYFLYRIDWKIRSFVGNYIKNITLLKTASKAEGNIYKRAFDLTIEDIDVKRHKNMDVREEKFIGFLSLIFLLTFCAFQKGMVESRNICIVIIINNIFGFIPNLEDVLNNIKIIIPQRYSDCCFVSMGIIIIGMNFYINAEFHDSPYMLNSLLIALGVGMGAGLGVSFLYFIFKENQKAKICNTKP